MEGRKKILKFVCNVCDKSYCLGSIYTHILSASHLNELKQMKEPITEEVTRIEIKENGEVVSAPWNSYTMILKESRKEHLEKRKSMIKFVCNVCHKTFNINSIYSHINTVSHKNYLNQMKESITEVVTRIETKVNGEVVSKPWNSSAMIPKEPRKKVKCEICNKEIYDYNQSY